MHTDIWNGIPNNVIFTNWVNEDYFRIYDSHVKVLDFNTRSKRDTNGLVLHFLWHYEHLDAYFKWKDIWYSLNTVVWFYWSGPYDSFFNLHFYYFILLTINNSHVSVYTSYTWVSLPGSVCLHGTLDMLRIKWLSAKHRQLLALLSRYIRIAFTRLF